MKYGYVKENNQYVLYGNNNDVILKTDRLAIAFTIDPDLGCILHKHGMPKYVKSWYTTFIKLMKEQGSNVYDDLASKMKYVVSPNIPVDEINKMIDLTGYLPECIRGMIDIN